MPFIIEESSGVPPTTPLKPEIWLWLQIAAQEVLEELEQMQLEAEQQQGAVPRILTTTPEPPHKEHPSQPPPLSHMDISTILTLYGSPEITDSELRAYGAVQGKYLNAEIVADGDTSDDIDEILTLGEFGESGSALSVALRDHPELIETVLEISQSPEEALGLLFAYDQNPEMLRLLLEPRKDDNISLSISFGLPGDYSPKGDPSFVKAPKSSEEAIGRFVQAVRQIVSLKQEYGVTLTTEVGYPTGREGITAWLAQPERIGEAYQAVVDTSTALQRAVENSSLGDQALRIAPYVPLNISGAELFRKMMGPVELQMVSTVLPDDPSTNLNESTTSAQVQGIKQGTETVLINLYPIEVGGLQSGQFIPSRFNIVHEFGHAINVRTGGAYALSYVEKEITLLGQKTDYAEAASCSGNINSGLCRQHAAQDTSEEWADRFLFWVYNGFNEPARKYQADQWMADVIGVAYGHRVMSNESLPDIARQLGAQFLSGTTTDQLNIRELPGLSGTPFGVIAANASVLVLGTDKTGAWVLVVHDGYMGWVSKEYIDMPDANLTVIDQEAMDRLTARGYDSSWNRIPASLMPLNSSEIP
jgi:hypothetical protein